MYLAIQDSTDRRVAIKVLKHGHISSALEQARFEREVKVLGQLKHRGIVTIHDSGLVDGLPYLVMDYVAGVPLDRYHYEASPNRDVTLTLMIEIAEAVQAAHVRGVIHRDLKPANILVDDAGAPIIVDFGLARLDSDAGSSGPLTKTGQFIGSLPWAAPEQVRGVEGEIDTRTDVYALGAIYYQLLTGHLPHDAGGAFDEFVVRLTTITPKSLRSFDRSISDDLDTIVRKCLSFEPARRYPTAGELAADLQRHARGEPIAAHPPSMTYLLKKHFQRHRLRAAALAVALAALILGGTTALGGMWWALKERSAARSEAEAAMQAREDAQSEQQRAERVVAFMKTILDAANPAVARGRDASLLKELLEEAGTRLQGGEFDDAPLARLELLVTLSQTLNHLGEFAQARNLAEEAVRRAEVEGTRAVRWRVGALQHWAYAVLKIGTWDEAERIAEQTADLARAQLSDDDELRYEAIEILALVRMEQYQWEPTLALLEEVYEGKARILGENHNNTLTTRMNMGKPLSWLGRVDESIDVYQRALVGFESALGRDHVQVATTLTGLANQYRIKGDLEQARRLQEEAVDINTRHRGPEHGHTLFAKQNLGKIYQTMGRTKEAEALMREVLPGIRNRYGVSQNTATAAYNLGLFLFKEQRFEEAIPFFKESHECWVATTSENHQYTLSLLGLVANAQMRAGRLDESADINERLLALASTNDALDDEFLEVQKRRAGECERMRGRYPAAVAFLEQAFEHGRRAEKNPSELSPKSAGELAETYEAWAANRGPGDPHPEVLQERAECWRSGPCRTGS